MTSTGQSMKVCTTLISAFVLKVGCGCALGDLLYEENI